MFIQSKHCLSPQCNTALSPSPHIAAPQNRSAIQSLSSKYVAFVGQLHLLKSWSWRSFPVFVCVSTRSCGWLRALTVYELWGRQTAWSSHRRRAPVGGRPRPTRWWSASGPPGNVRGSPQDFPWEEPAAASPGWGLWLPASWPPYQMSHSLDGTPVSQKSQWGLHTKRKRALPFDPHVPSFRLLRRCEETEQPLIEVI